MQILCIYLHISVHYFSIKGNNPMFDAATSIFNSIINNLAKNMGAWMHALCSERFNFSIFCIIFDHWDVLWYHEYFLFFFFCYTFIYTRSMPHLLYTNVHKFEALSRPLILKMHFFETERSFAFLIISNYAFIRDGNSLA